MTPMVVVFGSRDGLPRQILGFYPIREATLAIDRVKHFLRMNACQRHIRLQIDIDNPQGLPAGQPAQDGRAQELPSPPPRPRSGCSEHDYVARPPHVPPPPSDN